MPLMKHDESPEKVLEKCARRLESEVPDEEERSTLYLCLGVMSSLKYPREIILKVLEVIKMENSPLFDGIREEWETRGEIRGIEKGIEKGRKEGHIEGHSEGIVEAILEALEENTGQRPGWLKESLSTIKDGDLLKKILRRAVKSKSVEEFAKECQALVGTVS